jgi:hypothetical protein
MTTSRSELMIGDDGSMPAKRWLELSKHGGKLTLAEQRSGWHFCPEYDEELTQGEERRDDGSCAWCGFDGSRFNYPVTRFFGEPERVIYFAVPGNPPIPFRELCWMTTDRDRLIQLEQQGA